MMNIRKLQTRSTSQSQSTATMADHCRHWYEDTQNYGALARYNSQPDRELVLTIAWLLPYAAGMAIALVASIH